MRVACSTTDDTFRNLIATGNLITRNEVGNSIVGGRTPRRRAPGVAAPPHVGAVGDWFFPSHNP